MKRIFQFKLALVMGFIAPVEWVYPTTSGQFPASGGNSSLPSGSNSPVLLPAGTSVSNTINRTNPAATGNGSGNFAPSPTGVPTPRSFVPMPSMETAGVGSAVGGPQEWMFAAPAINPEFSQRVVNQYNQTNFTYALRAQQAMQRAYASQTHLACAAGFGGGMGPPGFGGAFQHASFLGALRGASHVGMIDPRCMQFAGGGFQGSIAPPMNMYGAPHYPMSSPFAMSPFYNPQQAAQARLAEIDQRMMDLEDRKFNAQMKRGDREFMMGVLGFGVNTSTNFLNLGAQFSASRAQNNLNLMDATEGEILLRHDPESPIHRSGGSRHL